jgi:large subunit ribosomal protein L9
MPTSQVILREKIVGRGAEADVVKVRAGYARNFLVPSGKAFEATNANIEEIEALKVARAEREAEELNAAQALAKKISKFRPKFTLETGQAGKAFGSITSIDIHKELAEGGIEVERHAIELDKPIKGSGKHQVEIQLHPDIKATLSFNVEATGGETA